MKAFVVFYNILKNEATESYGKNPNFKLKLAGQIWLFFSRLSRFLVPPFGFFRVERVTCRCIERIDIGEDVGREKNQEKIF